MPEKKDDKKKVKNLESQKADGGAAEKSTGEELEKSGGQDTEQKSKKDPSFSSKKILFVDIDDEITTVYDRVRRLKHTEIYIVVPKRASLLNSVVNLKILSRKLKDIGKSLFIITNDKMGVNLALQAEIPVYEKSEEELQNPEGEDKPQVKISPITALKNFLEEEKPVRLQEKKYAIFDLLKKSKSPAKETAKNLKSRWKFRNKSSSASNKPKISFRVLRGYRGTVSVLILASVVLLFAVSYIALPGATIYIKPKSNVIEQSVNIIMADNEKNAAELGTHPPNVIAAYRVLPAQPISKIFQYNATGQNFQGENSRGEIIIVNTAPRTWDLIAQTRFQSPEGIIFRLQERVTVPAATAEGFGTLPVLVVADEKDINGQVVGEKGNIGPSRFVLPALRESSQQQIYGKSEKAMTGGKTVVTSVVLKEDIEAAKEFAKKEIINQIIPSLNQYVSELNKERKTNLALLTEQEISWKRAIYYDEPQIVIDESLVGKQMDSFEVTARINAKGMAFNYDEFVNILKRELTHRQLPQKKLISIDENSIGYRLHTHDPDRNKYTVSATIKGIEEFELDPEKENGKRLVKKITSHILGWDIDEAEKFIQNLDEVERVEIKTWPVWAPTIPNLENNVKVEVIEE